MSFRVGQKVVFVGGGSDGCHVVPVKTKLEKGKQYTIREIDDVYTPYFGFPGIRVEEIINNKVRWVGGETEPCRTADEFRPIVEHKTDISIFTKMLTPKQREHVSP